MNQNLKMPRKLPDPEKKTPADDRHLIDHRETPLEPHAPDLHAVHPWNFRDRDWMLLIVN